MKTFSLEDYCNLLEKVAELEHEQWIKWSKTIVEKENISQERRERWQKLWVPYQQLSLEDKRQDIFWARKVLNEIPSLCPLLEKLRQMLQCQSCPYYKRCLKKMENKER